MIVVRLAENAESAKKFWEEIRIGHGRFNRERSPSSLNGFQSFLMRLKENVLKFWNSYFLGDFTRGILKIQVDFWKRLMGSKTNTIMVRVTLRYPKTYRYSTIH